MLDEFQVVLHSTDPICPVGILHPLAFHLEKKSETVPLGDSNKNDDVCLEELDLVCEVQGDCQQRCENILMSTYAASKLVEVDNQKLQISRTKMDNTFSISCWLQDSSKISAGNTCTKCKNCFNDSFICLILFFNFFVDRFADRFGVCSHENRIATC